MGMPFQIVFVPEGRASSGMLLVTFEYPCPFAMQVNPVGAMPHIGDLFSRGKTIQIGDEGSDDRFLIRVESEPEKAEHYAMNKANQETLKKAFQQGFVSVRYSAKGITLSRPGRFLQGGVTSEELLNYLAFAARLGERF